MTDPHRNPREIGGFLFSKNLSDSGLHFPKTIVDYDAVVNDKRRTNEGTNDDDDNRPDDG
jgi:hypothetical protein